MPSLLASPMAARSAASFSVLVRSGTSRDTRFDRIVLEDTGRLARAAILDDDPRLVDFASYG